MTTLLLAYLTPDGSLAETRLDPARPPVSLVPVTEPEPPVVTPPVDPRPPDPKPPTPQPPTKPPIPKPPVKETPMFAVPDPEIVAFKERVLARADGIGVGLDDPHPNLSDDLSALADLGVKYREARTAPGIRDHEIATRKVEALMHEWRREGWLGGGDPGPLPDYPPLPGDTSGVPPVTPPAGGGAVQPLCVEGTTFRLPDGRIWKYRGVTAFTALQDYIAGDMRKLEAYVAWARSLTPEPTLRVFGMWSMTGFDPRRVPGYYDHLDGFGRWLRSLGCRLHYVAFTDQVSGSSVLMTREEQDAHVRNSVETLFGAPHVLYEVINEDFKNGGIAARFPRDWFSGVLATRSSWPDGDSPATVGSVLDWTTEHTPRDEQSERKAKNLLETSVQGMQRKDGDRVLWTWAPSNKPAVGGEPPRVGDKTPRECADYYALAELFAAGACIHGAPETLQRCNLPNAQEQACIAAITAVWAGNIVPADAQLGDYARGPNGDCPLAHIDRYNEGQPFDAERGALRTFAMKRGNRAWVLVLDPGPAYEARAQGGWRIVATTGPHGQLYEVAR